MTERIEDTFSSGRKTGIHRLRYNPSPIPVDAQRQSPLFDESGNPIQIGDSSKPKRQWMPEGFVPPKNEGEHWTDIYDR